MQFQSYTFTSCTKTHINYEVYLPSISIRPKGIVQIHHGLHQDASYYRRFGDFLSDEGYIVCICDFPGHGKSLYKDEKGYFGQENCSSTFVEDVHTLRLILSERYPELPFFMIGVQFGSMVIRKYVSKYGDYINGAIYISPSDNVFLKKRFRFYVHMSSIIKGKMHRSISIFNMLQHSNGDDNHRLDKSIRAVVDCFHETTNLYVYPNCTVKNIIELSKQIQSTDCIKNTPDYLPLYVVYSENDEYGEHGKSATCMHQRLKNKMKDISIRSIDTSTKHLLCSDDSYLVFQDLLKWLNTRTY